MSRYFLHKNSPGPFDLHPEFIARVRDVFEAANFSESGILERLGGASSVRIDPREIPRLLRLTAEETPLDILIRLFVFGVNVSIEPARRAIKPMRLESWCEGGLLRIQESSVMAPLRLAPYGGFLLAFDPPANRMDREARADHIHGIGQASVNLLNATIRHRTRYALDLGTGCGIQGMMCAGHTEKVISTDINPRALNIAAFNTALNGLKNIEFQKGDLFVPVKNLQFDLITMNPPFAISPDVRFIFRDGGMEGDEFVHTVIRKAPKYLTEGGFCQITAQWAHIRGKEWQKQLGEWFKDTGCDVFVILLATQSAETYAANWISETEKHDAAGYVRRWEEWMAYYNRLGIEAVSTGIINMRRVSGRPNGYWVHEDVERLDESGGEFIAQAFELYHFLMETPDAALLDIPFQIVPEAQLEHRCQTRGDGWQPVKLVLRHTKGIHYSGTLDIHMAGFLGRCNGQRPLKSLIDDLAASLSADKGEITRSALEIMHGLIQRGFVLPPVRGN